MSNATTVDGTAAAFAVAEHALEGINHNARVSLGHAARLELVSQARRIANRMNALVSVLVAEADSAGSSMAVKGTPMTTWLG